MTYTRTSGYTDSGWAVKAVNDSVFNTSINMIQLSTYLVLIAMILYKSYKSWRFDSPFRNTQENFLVEEYM